MIYSQQMLFCEDIDFDADDEIDALFSQLEIIEPPHSLVDRILASVAQLPAYPLQEEHESNELLVHKDHLEPS